MFTQQELKNIHASIELAFGSGRIVSSQDAAALLSLQQKTAGLIEQEALPGPVVEFADED